MNFKELIEVVKSIVGSHGVSRENVVFFILSILSYIVYKRIDKYLEKSKQIKNKKINLEKQNEQFAQIDPIVNSIIKKLKYHQVVRSCVCLFSNGGEFLNRMSIYRMTMMSEKTLKIDTKLIRNRYQDTILNGKYKKLFKNLELSIHCYLQIKDLEPEFRQEFVDDGEKSIFLHMLYMKDYQMPIGLVVITFSKEHAVYEKHLKTIYNDVKDIETILNR